MTVSSTSNKATHTGDGVTVEFVYTYQLTNIEWMQVYLDEALQDAEYTITPQPDDEGGTVTFVTPPAVDVIVTLLREIDLTQDTDYPPYNAFPAKSHENALDKLTMIAQQGEEVNNRTLIASVITSADVSYVLPPPDADKVLVWATDALSLINGPSIGTFQDWANSAQTSADDAAASAASASASAASAYEANLVWTSDAYDAGTTYPMNTAIAYLGSSFRAVQETTGNTPTEGVYWTTIAQKGDAGVGTGDMLAANNLSEVDPLSARGNIGLGAVDNTADTDKPVSTPQAEALALKANLVSPALTGEPTSSTPIGTDQSTKIATTNFVRGAISTYTPAPTIPTGWQAIGTYAAANTTTTKTAGTIYSGAAAGLGGNQWRCMGVAINTYIPQFGDTVYTYLYVRIS